MACLSGSGVGLSETNLKMNDLSSASSLCVRSENLMMGLGSGRKGNRRANGNGIKAMVLQGKFKGTQMREKKLTELIEKKVMEAKEVCQGDPVTDECKVAWDEVEEVSQAKADLRLKLDVLHKDPLESFCQDNPETDECRIYED